MQVNKHKRRVPQAMFLLSLVCSTAHAGDFDQYRLTGSFQFPTITTAADQGPVVFDNLSDGRLIAVSTLVTDPNTEFVGIPKVYLETAVSSRQFVLLGDLPLPDGAKWSSSGGAFLRTSVGLSTERRIAVGNNRFDAPLIGVMAESDLLAKGLEGAGLEGADIDWFPTGHFDAAWYDNRYLAISNGSGTRSQVDMLDTDSLPTTPDIVPLVTGIAGASGGVGFDSVGNLVTANGFEDGLPGGSTTGTIKRFQFAAWQAVIQGSPPLNFETDGNQFATLLSGGSLAFDRQDNLLVGGSNFFGGGQADFFALVPAPGVPLPIRTFDPDTTAVSFYVLSYNEVAHEFYANEPFALDFPPNIDNRRAYVYRPLLAGDMDCDDDVDFDDIDPLVVGLTEPAAYEAQFHLPPAAKGDLDADGDLDFDDIDEFVALLSPVSREQTVPEPPTWTGMMAAMALWATWRLAQGRSDQIVARRSATSWTLTQNFQRTSYVAERRATLTSRSDVPH